MVTKVGNYVRRDGQDPLAQFTRLGVALVALAVVTAHPTLDGQPSERNAVLPDTEFKVRTTQGASLT